MEFDTRPLFAYVNANGQDWPIKFLEDGSTRFVPENSDLFSEFELFKNSNSLSYYNPEFQVFSAKPLTAEEIAALSK